MGHPVDAEAPSEHRQRAEKVVSRHPLSYVIILDGMEHRLFINEVPAPTLGRAFGIINQMVADGVVTSYALGGAMAAAFYVEPDTTYDVDIFCVLPGNESEGIDILKGIYAYLGDKGYRPSGEAILIEGFRFQFLPVFTELTDEAVENARTIPYQGVNVRVMSPEYLIAIMLTVGRGKDRVRVIRFIEAGDVFDSEVLHQMLTRYGLSEKFEQIKRTQEKEA